MKVLVIDDDSLVAISLKTILEADADIEVAAIGHNGKEAVAALTGGTKSHYYCIYEYDYYQNGSVKTRYFNYGVLTYIFLDLPFGFDLKLPVYSETEKIFHFTE